MKIYLKFDHSQKDSLKAIGCEYDGEQVNERIFEVIDEYGNDDSLRKTSQLMEIIHNKLEYEEILFLATHSVQDSMQRMMVQKMADELRDFLNL